MAINTETFESTIQNKLDTATDIKDLLLLSKVVESTVGAVAVSDIQNAGSAKVQEINNFIANETPIDNPLGVQLMDVVPGAHGDSGMSNFMVAARGGTVYIRGDIDSYRVGGQREERWSDTWRTVCHREGKTVQTIEQCYYSVFVLYTDGELWGWGANANRQQGSTSTYLNNSGYLAAADVQFHPHMIIDNVREFRATVGGGYYQERTTCFALKNDDTLWAWGSSDNGGTGNNTTTDYNDPAQVMTNVKSFDHEGGHTGVTAVITHSNNLYTTGWNGYGVLGLGDVTRRTVFTQVTSMNGIAKEVFITAGTRSGNGAYHYNQMFVQTISNELWGCGYNADKRIGINSTASTISSLTMLDQDFASYPVAEFKRSRAGWGTFAYKDTNGDLWTWGYNNYGQTGLGHASRVYKPTKVLTGITDFYPTTGGSHYCYHNGMFVVKDNELFYTGYNGNGQSGLRHDTTSAAYGSYSFEKVYIPFNTNDIKRYYGSGNSSDITNRFLLNDGTMYGAGFNNYGQLTDDDHRGDIEIFTLVK